MVDFVLHGYIKCLEIFVLFQTWFFIWWKKNKNYRIFLMKNLWEYNGFVLFVCWQLWFDKKIAEIFLNEKFVKVQVQFVCWQLWFDEKNYGFFLNEKISIIVQICTFWLLITLICQENLWKNFFEWKIRETTTVLCCLDVDNFDLTRKIIEFFFNEKIVKILQFCTFWLLTTLIWQENCGIFL